MDCKTVLNITTRLRALSTWNAQFWSRAYMRLMRYFHPETRREFRLRGIPKYFIGKDPMLNPKVGNRNLWERILVLNINTFYLSLLIRVPEASMKSLRMDRISLDSFRVAWQKSIMSSTNYWCESFKPAPQRLRPLSWPPWILILICQPRPSAAIMKRKGESGSPCLKPQVALKGVEGTPLRRIK